MKILKKLFQSQMKKKERMETLAMTTLLNEKTTTKRTITDNGGQKENENDN